MAKLLAGSQVTGVRFPLGPQYNLMMNERREDLSQKLGRRWFREKLEDSFDILRQASVLATPALVTFGSLVYLGVSPSESSLAAAIVYVGSVLERRMQIVPKTLDYMEHLLYH